VFLKETDLDAPSSAEAISDHSHFGNRPADFTVAPRIRFPVPQADRDPLDEGLHSSMPAPCSMSRSRGSTSRVLLGDAWLRCPKPSPDGRAARCCPPLLDLAALEIKMGEYISADSLLNRAAELAESIGSGATFRMASMLHSRGRGLATMGFHKCAAKANCVTSWR
jgi:hypothetical protein